VAIPTPMTFSGRGAGAFGARGGIITTNVLGDDELELGFVKLAGYVEDAALPLKASEEIAKASIHRRFKDHDDPGGTAWQPLSDRTVRRKARDPKLRSFPEDILTLTGDMETRATADESFTIMDDQLVWSSEYMPSYWGVHQYGSGEFESMEAFGLSGTQVVQTGTLQIATTEGRGKATPARPFVGLDSEAEIEIVEVFDAWYDEGVSLAINPRTGVAQERVSGRFGARLFPRG
jgi:phage gpG-like protein